MAAARIANMPQGGRTDLAQICAKLSQSQTAALLNVSRRGVQSAKQVIDHGTPELVQAVESGKVAISVAAVVAKLPETEQAEVLTSGEADMSRVPREIKQRVIAANRKEANLIIKTPPLPAGKYRCIVVDPPWPVQKIEREERPSQGDKLDYPTMTVDEIRDLPVAHLAADDGCHIYLWVTQKFLPTGLALLESWGVNYQCCMTWVKPTGMTPYSWMYNTEHVLFGHIGNLPLERLGLKLSFEAPVTKHSAKPAIFYDRVVQASPVPRIDLFARCSREGFDVWGNEVT